MSEGPRADPGHAGEIISLDWFVSFSVSLEELEEVTGEREVWTSSLSLLPRQPELG